MHPTMFKIPDYLQQMAHGAGQPIETQDDEDVSRCELAQQFGQDRPSARNAGAMLLIDPIAAGPPQLVQLGIVGLVIRRHAGVTD